MATRTLQLPAWVCQQLSMGKVALSARVRELAIRELAEERPLSVIPADQKLESFPVPIAESVSAQVQALRGRRGVGAKDSEARILARLAYTHLTAEAPRAHVLAREHTAGIPLVAELLEALPRPPREEQLLLARDLQPVFNSTHIALLEAATGTGKGLVIAAAAYAVAAGKQRALICAPTHQLNAQTHEDLRLIAATHGPVKVEKVFGRSSFVSPTRLKVLAEEEAIPEEQRIAAWRWMEEELRLFKAGARQDRFLVTKLEERVPEFPSREVTLGPGQSDEAAMAYEEQFVRAQAADIVIATMVMLAMEAGNARRDATRQTGLTIPQGLTAEERKQINTQERNLELIKVAQHGKLGPFFAVFVDEAHRLEEQFALAASDDISVFKLVRDIRDLPIGAAIKAEVQKAYEGLQSIGRRSESVRITQMSDGGSGDVDAGDTRRCIGMLVSALERATSRRPPSADAHGFQQIKDVCAKLKREVIGEDAGRNITLLDFSPIYRYPRICIGPRSVRATLDFFWLQFRCGAAFSATLYVTMPSGLRSANHVANRLSIPLDRRREHEPIIPAWITDPVTLHLADAVGHSHLLPPQKGSPQEDSLWKSYFDDHAGLLRDIARRAEGGTLVLCTSYLAVREISSRLRAVVPGRVIETLPSKFTVSLREFHAKAGAGERPIWVSVGSAWTGMNVYADGTMPPVETDLILTDLVIPKLPFNLNRLSTEIARRERSDGDFAYVDSLIDCALMTLQGSGRLIRRPGLKDRHLWVLDPRATRRGHATFSGIWKRYKHQVPIDALPACGSDSSEAPSQVTRELLGIEGDEVTSPAKKPLFSLRK